MADATSNHTISTTDLHKKERPEFIPKPRTAWFQGGENDEPMAPQIIQLGSYLFDVQKNNIKGVHSSTEINSSKLIFIGANLHKSVEKKKRRCIHIGSIKENTQEETDIPWNFTREDAPEQDLH